MSVIAAHTLTPNQGSMQIYNGLDACMTFEINDALRALPHANDTLIYNFELALQAPALEMMLRGFKVDAKAHERILRSNELKLTAALSVLNRLSAAVWDGPLNPNSGQQLRKFFYETMGIRAIQTSVKGKLKTPMDRKILERLEAHFFARPFVNAVLLCRDLAKQQQVLNTEIDSDWRWRTSYNIAGTDTGRWSSSKSVEGTGGNAQNITDELRQIFIPDEGKKLYGIDLEQAEAREVGWFCGTILGDWSYLNMIEAGDPHTYVARMCWPELPWTGDIKRDRGIAERKFYRHLTYRDATKRLSHGSNYMGRPATMSQETKIPLNIVAPFQERYFAGFPCIPQMHAWIARELQTKQYLTNAFGQRRDFFDRTSSDETIRSAVAYMFQSATANRLNLGMLRIWKNMAPEVELLVQLHDAVYFQCDPALESEIIPRALDFIRVELRHGNRSFTIPGEAVGGYNWAHRYKFAEDGTRIDWNPNGLAKVRLT